MNHELLRSLLAPWGTLQPQPSSDWRGEFPLPAVVAEFYENVGPWGKVVHAGQGPNGLCLDASILVALPPLRNLWHRQSGFRWNGNTLERSRGWKDDWLLVADADADPFILDMPTGRILFARHGAGGSYPEPFAKDLETAFGALATIANTKARLNETDAFLDAESFEILPAARVEIENDLASYLCGRDGARAILALLELWLPD